MARRRRTQNVVKFDDIKGFLDEFQKESPRGAALLGAAYLDECLKHLIASFLIEDSKAVDSLLGDSNPLAPLGDFYSRTEASYCMGLIGEDEHHDLQIIRRIRNDFAHELHGLTFSSEQVRNRCRELLLPKELPKRWRAHYARNTQSLFSAATSFLIVQLKMRIIEQQRGQRRVVPRSFEVVETVD